MFQIDSGKCTRCGSCVSVCPQQAITMHDGMAAINQELCIQCGACVEVCPVGAIHGIVPAYAKAAKGGETMPYGQGRRFGFGFAGAATSWPYIGRGRGGLPRCQHPGLLAGATPYCAAPTREGELGFLKNQADVMKSHLEEIEHRIQELEKTN
jgi:NAD-dependent dihydropyrimidine dehydrogenase PreA subunit